MNKNKNELLDDDSFTGVKSVDEGIFNIIFQIVIIIGFFIVLFLWSEFKMPSWVAPILVITLIAIPLFIYRFTVLRRKISPTTKFFLSLAYLGFFIILPIIIIKLHPIS